MTTQHKKLYRTASGSALLLLACLALAPTWQVTADTSPEEGTDECCDLAANNFDVPGPAHQLNDIPGYSTKPAPHRRGLPQQASHRHSDTWEGDHGADHNAPQPDPNTPTFAGTPGGANDQPTAEHETKHQPHYRRTGDYGSGANPPGPGGSHNVAINHDQGSTPGRPAGLQPNPDNPTAPTGDDTPPGDNGSEETIPGDNGTPLPPTQNPEAPVVSVPEPPAIALLAIGGLGLMMLRRRVGGE
jgi:hypothetical protein